jgi:hypothetical protein
VKKNKFINIINFVFNLMASPPKNFIFYSKKCEFSQNLLNIIVKGTIQEFFTFVCIDDPRINIPPYIKSVPSMILVVEKRVVVDDELFNYVNMLAKMKSGSVKNSSSSNNQQEQPRNNAVQSQMNSSTQLSNGRITGDDNISAYHNIENSSSLSDNYSFLTETNDDLAGQKGGGQIGLGHNFAFLDFIDRENGGKADAVLQPSMPSFTKPDDNYIQNEKGGAKKNGELDKKYEDFISQRNKDIPQGGTMRMM